MTLQDATVLIVDDEPALLTIFSGWFERSGSRVLNAENGVIALDLLDQHKVDLIISDIRMPVMDGIELARRVGQNGGYLPKIVFVSGFADLDDRESYAIGVEARLEKPISRKSLIDVARRCLTTQEERWTELPDLAPRRSFSTRYDSIATACAASLLAFGRGGICIRTHFAGEAGEPINLMLSDLAERQHILGQAVVRWCAPKEGLLGVEIIHIAEESMAFSLTVFGAHQENSFIPSAPAPRPVPTSFAGMSEMPRDS